MYKLCIAIIVVFIMIVNSGCQVENVSSQDVSSQENTLKRLAKAEEDHYKQVKSDVFKMDMKLHNDIKYEKDKKIGHIEEITYVNYYTYMDTKNVTIFAGDYEINIKIYDDKENSEDYYKLYKMVVTNELKKGDLVTIQGVMKGRNIKGYIDLELISIEKAN